MMVELIFFIGFWVLLLIFGVISFLNNKMKKTEDHYSRKKIKDDRSWWEIERRWREIEKEVEGNAGYITSAVEFGVAIDERGRKIYIKKNRSFMEYNYEDLRSCRLSTGIDPLLRAIGVNQIRGRSMARDGARVLYLIFKDFDNPIWELDFGSKNKNEAERLAEIIKYFVFKGDFVEIVNPINGEISIDKK